MRCHAETSGEADSRAGDRAVGIDEVVRRKRAHSVSAHDVGRTQQDRIGQLVLARVAAHRLDVRRVLNDGQQHLVGPEILREPSQRRQLEPAHPAPSREKVQQHLLPTELRERDPPP